MRELKFFIKKKTGFQVAHNIVLDVFMCVYVYVFKCLCLCVYLCVCIYVCVCVLIAFSQVTRVCKVVLTFV